MELKTFLKFPCGYEFHYGYKSHFWDLFATLEHETEPVVCPIHGKNCKRSA